MPSIRIRQRSPTSQSCHRPVSLPPRRRIVLTLPGSIISSDTGRDLPPGWGRARIPGRVNGKRSLDCGQGSPDALSSSAPLGILSQHRDSSPVATSAFEPERATTLRQAPNGNMALFGLHRDADGARSHGVAGNDRAHRPPAPTDGTSPSPLERSLAGGRRVA